MEALLLVFELIGTVAFAVSGAMTGLKKGMDLFGVSILGISCAVGRGIIRDLLLGITPPTTFLHPIYAAVAAVTALAVFLPPVRARVSATNRIFELLLLVMDSVGLGVFTVIGISTAASAGQSGNIFLMAFVGVITGVGGGVLRDVLAGNTPYIFIKHIYAVASLAGALPCAVLWNYLPHYALMLVSAALVITIRFLAAHYRWSLPK